jgi:hypothetical protein
MYAGLVIIAAVAATGVAMSRNAGKTELSDPFRAEQRSAVAFTLYYPSLLPENMEVDAASLATSDTTVVTMRITDRRGSLGQSFTITQQAANNSFNYETFYGSFRDKSSFDTSLGTVTTGTIDNGKTRLASLVANNKTWILVQAPPSLHLDQLQNVLNNLQPSVAATNK